jgi:secretion/DNA translocation related CpaE-like protein
MGWRRGSGADGGPGAVAAGARSGAAGRPLLGTSDPELLDDLLRLAAAGGVEVEVVSDAGALRARWTTAPLVVVGADCATALARTAPPRRSDVVVAVPGPADPLVWQQAVAIGADHVAELPDGERWLVERLADSHEGPPRGGPVLAVIGGRGGAGASTLATALAVVSAREGAQTLLVDADPWGGGLDLLLGGEEEPGLRWAELAATRGRVAAGSLAASLPRLFDVSVLSWGRDGTPGVPAEAMASLVDAGRRGFDRTVIDVGRCCDVAGQAALSLAQVTLLVVPAEVRAVAAAARVLRSVRDSTSDVRVVVRGRGGPDPDSVADALGVALASVLPDEPGLAAATDRGDYPVSGPRSRLARTASQLLREIGA